METRVWNVISAGPSRAFLRPSDLLPGAPVVTINRAIDVIDLGISVDFAVFADPPTKIVKQLGLERFLIPPLQIWCPRPILEFRDLEPAKKTWNPMSKSYDMAVKRDVRLRDHVSLWEPFLPASCGIRTTPFGSVKAQDGAMRYMFSTLAALERIMMFRPQKIRILCADMSGSWAANMSEEECEKQQQGSADGPFKRWEHERYCLDQLEERAKGVGCSFEYRSPREVVVA